MAEVMEKVITVTADDAPSGPPTEAYVRMRRIFAGLLMLFAAVGTAAALHRGPWLDEFWSFARSDPSLPLARLIADGWLTAPHPPISTALYTLVRLTGVREIAFARLLLNLPALALFAAGTYAFGKRAQTGQTFYLLFGLLLVGYYEAMEYFVDFRGYFWLFCLCGLAIEYLYFTVTDPSKADRASTLDLIGLTAIVLSVCFHFVAGVLVSVCYSLFVPVLWRMGRTAAAKRIAASLVLAWLLMLADAWFQLPRVMAVNDEHWITTDTMRAAFLELMSQVKVMVSNPIASVLALVSLAVLIKRREWPHPFVITLSLSIVLGAIGMLGLNAASPIIVSRYLLPWQVMGTAIVAFLAAPLTGRAGWLLAISVISVVMTLAQPFRVAPPNWNAGLGIVRSIADSCPQTRTLVTGVWRFRPSSAGISALRSAKVATEAQLQMAQRAGLHVTVLDNTTPLTLSATGPCPTLLWVEHTTHKPLDLEAGKMRIAPGTRARILVTDTGQVMELTAAAPAAQKGDR
jgi:hypothetical protein